MKFSLENGPFIKDSLSKKGIKKNIIIALIPIILYAFIIYGIIPYTNGYLTLFGLFYPLIFVIVGAFTAYISEALFAKIFLKQHNLFIKDYMRESNAIITGTLISLLVPINTSIYMLIIGIILASFIKIILGGSNKCFINPAIIGVILIILIFGHTINLNGGYNTNYAIDNISSSTPLATLKANNFDLNSLDNYNFISLFINNNSGTMATICPLLVIFTLLFLSLTNTIKWRISLSYLGTFTIMTFILGIINNQLLYPVFQVLIGGILFASIFLATDSSSTPIYKESQYLYGIFLGIFTVIFRQLTSISDGTMLAILIMNLVTFIFNAFSIKYYFKKWLIAFPIIVMAILSVLPYTIKDKSAKYLITNKYERNSKVIYEAKTKGFNDDIEIEVIINSGVIEVINIKKNNDYYSSFIDNKYTINLLKKQNNLKDVDAVSGATISSIRIKNLLTYIINDYNSSNYGYKIEYSKNEIKKFNDNYEIIGTTRNGEETNYKVKVKSLNAYMLMNITFVNNEVINIEFTDLDNNKIYDKNDIGYLNKVKNAGYINNLINNQNDLTKVDAISGATTSSLNIKEAFENVIKKYDKSLDN